VRADLDPGGGHRDGHPGDAHPGAGIAAPRRRFRRLARHDTAGDYALLFGIAGGQLPYGSVSDKFGRRPTLLVSLGLYFVASAVAGWAAGSRPR